MIDRWRPYAELHPGPGHTVVGDLRVVPGVGGPGIAPREILALVPAGAATSGLRYPVLYFHDGQNVFDELTSFSGEWRVDETMADLAAEGIEALVIGIPNAAERRFAEYTPWATGVEAFGSVAGDGTAHLRFVVEVVKPLVDASFPVLREAAATAIVGSSLGGLMSAWAGWERPDVFGLVGAMSPALGFGQGPRLLDRIAAGRGRPGRPGRPARLWIDIGGGEGRAAADGARQLRDAAVAAGFRDGIDLRYVEEPGAPHHESAWSRRLPEALRFLLADARPVADPDAEPPVAGRRPTDPA